MENNYDIISIGEIAIDAFIRLKDASTHCDINKENCQICMAFGTKIPYESVTEVPAVANAGNASVSAARIGLRSALVANMGADRNGNLCLESLKKDGVSTEFIRAHKDKDTNYHYVLWFEDDRTILQKHSDFDYKLPDLGNPKWIYLTSLGEKSLPYHEEILEYLEEHPDVKLAFQPGIFQIKMGSSKLKGIYEKTEVFFCNVEEAKTILNIEQHDEIKDLLKKMRELGPKTVVITDGPRGSYSYDGTEFLSMIPYPDPKPPFERTGAGDAFSSTVIEALILGKTLAEALAWGGVNAMSVVQYIGAQKGLLSREKLEEYLKNAPEDYKAKKI
ncbi:MAG TPA: carbohydrate kinase family protein [Candidatus Paceibacterota bacterium]|jgi:ribokinase|nr:carbohydrate kinase family protein [Candidatus Paceibacterota bacterium]